MEQRCDEDQNCDDNSDEINCKTLDIDEDRYRKDKPPLTFAGTGVSGKKNRLPARTQVNVDVTVMSLDSFKELEMTFKATVKLVLTWFDHRLMFRNIKFGKVSGNVIGREESERVIEIVKNSFSFIFSLSKQDPYRS